VKSAGLDEQFPEEIIPLAEAGGVSEEHMRMHWRAHWQLPSPNMAYEMYHRGYLSLDGVRALLKAADYAPGYIDAMVGIANATYTRVDARRMLKIGVLDDEGFLDAMREIGYDDEKAANLLAFARSVGGETEKDLTMSQMMKAYSLGLAAYPDVKAYLVKLGYDETEAGLLIALEDEKKAQKLTEERIKISDWHYARGDYSEAMYLDALASEGIPIEKAHYHLTLAALSAEKQAKLPTKADVEKWLKKGYISEGDAMKYLTQIGYKADERWLYLREWSDEMTAPGDES